MNYFELKPSQQLLSILVVAHGLALAIVFLMMLSLSVKMAAAVLILLSAYYYVRREVWRVAPDAIIALHLDAARTATITMANGSCWEGSILNTSFVSAKLTIVNVRLSAKRGVRHVIVLSDTLAAEDFRHLRVLLRWRYGRRGKHDAVNQRASRG